MEGIAALALVLFLLIPGIAYASVASDQYGEPVYGPVTYDWQGETWTSVAYIAANKFDAAAYACGYSKSEIGQWDLTVRAKLSNESTAPDFYELASGFYAPVADDFVYTDHGPAPGFWGWAYSIYGEGNIWYHDGYTDTQVNDAKSEVEAILNGGGSGGGSGGEFEDVDGFKVLDLPATRDPYEQSSTTIYRINSITKSAAGVGSISRGSGIATLTWNEGSTFRMYADDKSFENMSTYLTGQNLDPEEAEYLYCRSWGTTYVMVFYGDYEIVRNGNSEWFYVKNPSETETLRVITFNSKENNVGMYNEELSCFLFNCAKNHDLTINPLKTNSNNPIRPYWSSDGDFEEPTIPDSNWPDPDTPTVPDPPNPDAPTGGGDYVVPTLPKPTSPTQPVGVSVTVATPVDDILDALNKIIQELENHCVHLQNKMVECSKYLGALEEQTRDAVIDAINEGMQNDVTLHDELMDYLRELLQWMKDNMKYDVEVTNTNNNDDVIDWLKRIYIQDGTGYSNSRPIDITQDYNGFGVWVDSLLGYVLPDLTDTNLAPVTSAFDALDDKFPFSVPGDVLRIFQSLDRSPVTPVVAVTIPSVLGIPAYTYSFDLSPYDTTMQTIRTIELMAFVVFLLVWARRAFNAEAGGASD